MFKIYLTADYKLPSGKWEPNCSGYLKIKATEQEAIDELNSSPIHRNAKVTRKEPYVKPRVYDNPTGHGSICYSDADCGL